MRTVAFLAALLAVGPAWGLGWRQSIDTAAPIVRGLSDTLSTAYFVFVSGDSTTSTGPVLETGSCGRLEATLFEGGASAGIKIYETSSRPSEGPGDPASIAITNLPQITTDFNADGVVDADALDCSDTAHCGLRDFMADGIVPTITADCDTGTCALKVQGWSCK